MKAPEMTPLAMAVGKMRCASFVIGVDKTIKSTGGMTSLNLSGVSTMSILAETTTLTCPWGDSDGSRASRSGSSTRKGGQAEDRRCGTGTCGKCTPG